MISFEKEIFNGGGRMGKVQSSEDLMKYISKMDGENSVVQFSIPGKGKFTVLQEEDDQSIQADVEKIHNLNKCLQKVKNSTFQGLGFQPPIL